MLTTCKKNLRYIVVLIRRVSNLLNINMLQLVNGSLFLSVWSYRIVGWVEATSTVIRARKRPMGRVLKVIDRNNRKFPTDQLYTISQELDVRRTYFCWILKHYIKNGLLIYDENCTTQFRHGMLRTCRSNGYVKCCSLRRCL